MYITYVYIEAYYVEIETRPEYSFVKLKVVFDFNFKPNQVRVAPHHFSFHPRSEAAHVSGQFNVAAMSVTSWRRLHSV